MIKLSEFLLKSSYKLNEKKYMINFLNILNYSTDSNNENNKNSKSNRISKNFKKINKSKGIEMHFQEEEKKKRLAFISAKLNFGQGKRGTELGPQHIKQDFLFSNLENLSKFLKYSIKKELLYSEKINRL